MPQPTAKTRSSESPKSPPPETSHRRAQIATGVLLLTWLIITSSADVIAPRVGDLLTAIELRFDLYTVLDEDAEE